MGVTLPGTPAPHPARVETLNGFGQPVGWTLDAALPRPRPGPVTLTGTRVRVEPLRDDHVAGLFARIGGPDRAALWTYMADGPFPEPSGFAAWVSAQAASQDPLHFALIDLETGTPQGMAAFLRIAPGTGVVEIGSLMFSKALQRTPAATEALALMMGHVFNGLGYRRLEWKCDALNAPSRRAAERLGFSYEGTFRQATVYKGRNRDTAWYSVIDADWPGVQAGLVAWLDPGNFDPVSGRQWRRLEACRVG